MAISKVAYDGHTLIDLTQDTAIESDVASGKTFHKADGTQAVGIASGGGGTVNLQNKTVNLGSSAPSSVSADAGYDGLGQVSFNVSGISANKIKDGESICGVLGTYAALTYDSQVVTPPIGIIAPVTFTLGWKPDILVFDWSEETEEEGETVIDYYRRSLTADGSIESGNDTVTFTSTGYTVMMDGTYWNDNSERFGAMTITAIKMPS